MHPDAAELAAAVREFLEKEILPALTDPRLKFRALVAGNALGILGRDLALGPSLAAFEAKTLGALLGEAGDLAALNTLLCSQIRNGAAPAGTLEALLQIAERKLQIASPEYSK